MPAVCEKSSNYQYSVSDPRQTGVTIVSSFDPETNITIRTPLANNAIPVGSIIAWTASRYSRSDKSAQELAEELYLSGQDASAKLAGVFRGYGHASVADMAILMAYVENVPGNYATKLFNETAIGGGQERSTRYQDFGLVSPIALESVMRICLPPQELNRLTSKKSFKELNREFQALQQMAIDSYRHYVNVLTPAYINEYGIDRTNKGEVAALRARVFDSARYFLPNGTCLRTSFAWQTSAREWARIISNFKAAKDPQLQRLALQLEDLFAPDPAVAARIGYTPEAAELIRHTSADETTVTNLEELDRHLDREFNFRNVAVYDHEFKFRPVAAHLMDMNIPADLKVVMQYILTIHPTVSEDWLISWLMQLDDESAKKIGEITFRNFTQHQQMGIQSRVSTHAFLLDGGLAEARDMNRHRAFGRFMPLISTERDFDKLILQGYCLPAYLYMNNSLHHIRERFEEDLIKYYDRLKQFTERALNANWFPHHVLVQLLPLGHATKLWLHGSIKETSYLTHLRVREGGHINYRLQAYMMSVLLGQSGRFSAALALGTDREPDVTSSDEFKSRK